MNVSKIVTFVVLAFFYFRKERERDVGRGRSQQVSPQPSNCPLSYLAPASSCSMRPLLYLLGLELISSVTGGFWQMTLLFLILWLFPPLPSEQITATIGMFCSFFPVSLSSRAGCFGPFRPASAGALLPSDSLRNQHV